MEELQLLRGDTVRVKGKRGKETVCIVLGDETCDNNNVKLNKVRAPVYRRDAAAAGGAAARRRR